MKSYINVCDVEKYYGSAAGMTKAVDRVSFQVSEGEFVGVMGGFGLRQDDLTQHACHN